MKCLILVGLEKDSYAYVTFYSHEEGLCYVTPLDGDPWQSIEYSYEDILFLPEEAHEQDMLISAYQYAGIKHSKQTRKMSGQPYIHHPVAVCNYLPEGSEIEMMQAAILHDTLEDTNATEKYLKNFFGPIVSSLVVELTTPLYQGKRRIRKEYEALRLSLISADAQTIKYCDINHNLHSLIKDYPTATKEQKAWMNLLLNEKTKCMKEMRDGDIITRDITLNTLVELSRCLF